MFFFKPNRKENVMKNGMNGERDENIVLGYYDLRSGDRAFGAFLIGITVFLLIGLVVGAELALDHCGCSWSSFWASF